ncbi:hypothetical protein [Scleromatobacter humisilvae]|uniref:Uncharacterized protein n=1 Tax=Scleromatobacter humisilvae TaxID=2897159 RepID=A0A9X1YH30_9BURK|nr:hypothetical protein [Scleromatobacter humisilvae]MCK9685602.1 hypothetical protein [Scleromatobacter humisilvae]
MQKTCHVRSGPRGGGYVTVGTLILAAVSAVMLVMMSGCHSTPASNAFAATPADKAVEARLKQPDPFPPLQPFDEHFVEVSDDGN